MENPEQKFRVVMNIRIEEQTGMHGSLSVNEEATITAMGFMSVAKILGEFHDLIQAMRKRG